MSLFFGLFLGLVGLDLLTGQARFTFGVPELLDGIDIVVVIVGLFAIGETLYIASRLKSLPAHVTPLEPARGRLGWLSQAGLGPIVGAVAAWNGIRLPDRRAALWRSGTPDLSFLHVREAPLPPQGGVRQGRDRGSRGTGGGEQRVLFGVLVPLLTLGIPVSATAAVMLAAFQIHNIQTGPELFEKSGDLVWALIASLFLGNLMLWR